MSVDELEDAPIAGQVAEVFAGVRLQCRVVAGTAWGWTGRHPSNRTSRRTNDSCDHCRHSSIRRQDLQSCASLRGEMDTIKDQTAIVGIGQTSFGKGLEDSELSLACQAIVMAIDNAGLKPSEVDGLAMFSMEN